MQDFINRLQSNVVVVLLMFLLSLLSAVITVILGWKDFYANFLSKQFSLPIWAVLLLALGSALLYLFRPLRLRVPKEQTLVEGKQFGVQAVEVDGKKFVNCTFDGSELVFKGISGFSMISNTFKVPPRFRFEDGAANTIGMLTLLYKDPVLKGIIDLTLSSKASELVAGSKRDK